MFVMPYVGNEEGGYVFFCQKMIDGDFSYVNYVPHTPLFGVVTLYKLTHLSLTTCAFIWNPLMGALSTILFYYILKNVLRADNPHAGAVLFSFLDCHIYRTTLFGSSCEGTAIVLGLLFIYLYFTTSKIGSLLLLPLILYSHLLVFGFSMLFVIADVLNQGRRELKKLLLIGGAGILILLGIRYLPYYLLFDGADYGWDILKGFSLSNILLYGASDLLLVLQTLLGTTILCVFMLFVPKKNGYLKYVSMGLFGALGFSVLFASHFVSPYRMLVYLGMVGIMIFSTLEVSWKKEITVGLVALMLFQVCFYGWRLNNRIYECVTEEEIEIVDWLREYDPDCSHYNVGWDKMGDQLLLIKMPIYTYRWIKYVIYSDRYAAGAFLLSSSQDGRRFSYSTHEIPDTWCNSTEWVLIYDGSGGRIYENSSWVRRTAGDGLRG